MKGSGHKITVRIWPEAVAALKSMKKTFPKISGYGLTEELISSAILHLNEQAKSGLGKIGGHRGWRPMPPSWEPESEHPPSPPRLHLV